MFRVDNARCEFCLNMISKIYWLSTCHKEKGDEQLVLLNWIIWRLQQHWTAKQSHKWFQILGNAWNLSCSHATFFFKLPGNSKRLKTIVSLRYQIHKSIYLAWNSRNTEEHTISTCPWASIVWLLWKLWCVQYYMTIISAFQESF